MRYLQSQMKQVLSYHQTYILVFLCKWRPITMIPVKKLSTGKIPQMQKHSLSISAGSMAQCVPIRYTQITLREEGHWIQQETLWPSKKLAYAVDEHLLQVFWVKLKWNASNAIISICLHPRSCLDVASSSSHDEFSRKH